VCVCVCVCIQAIIICGCSCAEEDAWLVKRTGRDGLKRRGVCVCCWHLGDCGKVVFKWKICVNTSNNLVSVFSCI